MDVQSKILRISLFLAVAGSLFSCSTDPFDVDLSGIEADIKIERMDQDLFGAESNSMSEVNFELQSKYGEFYEIYIGEIIGLGSPYDPMIDLNLMRFVSDLDMQDVWKAINTNYADLSAIEAELSECFRYYKYYFPEGKIPRVIAYHSGFNYGTYATDEILGIGLEMYLGRQHELVNALPHQNFPVYIKQKMDPEYLVPDAMIAWLHTNHFELGDNMDFLETIVAMGKNLYILDALMPNTPDHVKIHYSLDKWNWCMQNENNIWREIVDQELLFSKDQNEIFKFVTPGPFTAGLPKDSPARVGTWLGWRIVQAYMSDNPGISIPELLEEKDAQKILKSYKPAR